MRLRLSLVGLIPEHEKAWPTAIFLPTVPPIGAQITLENDEETSLYVRHIYYLVNPETTDGHVMLILGPTPKS